MLFYGLSLINVLIGASLLLDMNDRTLGHVVGPWLLFLVFHSLKLLWLLLNLTLVKEGGDLYLPFVEPLGFYCICVSLNLVCLVSIVFSPSVVSVYVRNIHLVSKSFNTWDLSPSSWSYIIFSLFLARKASLESSNDIRRLKSCSSESLAELRRSTADAVFAKARQQRQGYQRRANIEQESFILQTKAEVYPRVAGTTAAAGLHRSKWTSRHSSPW